jgi:4-amino-4-deoxy-L-arabinose transferase-like glycosyltransferase
MTEKQLSTINPQKWLQISILLGFCMVLYFLNLGQWDLWNPDEPRYAQVAREMVNGGDWVLMHVNGKIYPDKPPFFFWMIAFSSFLWQGFSSFSVRFPAALFGTLTVLLTFFLGRILYSSRTGFLSALILATSFEFAYLSTRANMDTTLTFFTTASLLCFFQWYRRYQGKAESPKKVEIENKVEEKAKTGNLWIYGFYIGMALATLTKGPVGFILPLLVSLIYLILQKDWKGIMKMRLFTGMALFLVIVLSWYLAALLRGGEDYLQATLFMHTIDRYSKGLIHLEPIYYYFYIFPGQFLPWIFFLPAAIYYGFSKETIKERRNFLFLLVWFAVIFLFFSLSKGKRPLYLLPLFPSVCLMVGKLWNDFTATRTHPLRHPWISFPFYALIALLLVAGGALPWIISTRYPSYLSYSLPVSFLMIGGGLTLFAFYRFRKCGVVFFLIVAIVAGGFFYALRAVFPAFNSYRSARFISRELASTIQPGEKLAAFRLEPSPYNYYTGIVPIVELETEKGLVSFLESRERVFCLIKSRDLDRIQARESLPMVELAARHHLGHRDVVLISNR